MIKNANCKVNNFTSGVIIENPNEEISYSEDIELKQKSVSNEDFLFKQLKELQTINKLLNSNFNNINQFKESLSNDIVEDRKKNSLLKTSKTLNSNNNKTLIKYIKMNSVGTKCYQNEIIKNFECEILGKSKFSKEIPQMQNRENYNVILNSEAENI